MGYQLLILYKPPPKGGKNPKFLSINSCYRLEMHPIPQVLNPPGKAIDGALDVQEGSCDETPTCCDP